MEQEDLNKDLNIKDGTIEGFETADEKVAETFVEETKKEDKKVGETFIEETKMEEENIAEASIEENNQEDEKVVEASAGGTVEAATSKKKTAKGLKEKTKTHVRRLVKLNNGKRTPTANESCKEKNGNVLEGNEEGTSMMKKNDMELNRSVANNKEVEEVAEASVEGNDKEVKKVTEGSAGASDNADSSEKDVKKVTEGASENAESSERKTPKQLKAKAMIRKPRATQLLQNKGILQIQENNKMKKTSVLEGNKEDQSIEKKNNTGNNVGGGQQKTAFEAVEKNEQNHSTQEKTGLAEDGKQNVRRRGRRGLKKNKRFKKEPEATEMKQQMDHGGSGKNQSNKEKQVDPEKRERNEKKKEKLGGLIFMCNAKTKPDCFRYRVMGVTENKKNLVMSIKPGHKVFLYDYDLKLLYGIYQASSLGGMKLEPKAFGGSFPAQVRFKVQKDCNPVPESEFRKAIKENYNTKNKFKTELTPKQVAKLRRLFRPAAVYSSGIPTHPRPVPPARDADRERSKKDRYAPSSSRSHNVHTHERDYWVSLPRREDPHDLYPREIEYRAYGLKRGERSNQYTIPDLDPYRRDLERDRLMRHPDFVYKAREAVHTDPLYLSEREYRAYDLSGRREYPVSIPQIPPVATVALDSYARDPYYTYAFGASVTERPETYRVTSRREDGLYSRYASDSLPDHYQSRRYQGAATAELAPSLVMSQYSFPGPSYSHR